MHVIGLIMVIAFGIDLAVFFIASLLTLPTGFTSWVCYPFWPIIFTGVPMFFGILIRFLEIFGLIGGVILLMY